jgi:tetratricopeptide (TPR) repeat protein
VRWLGVLVIVGLAANAHAEPADDLRAEGEQLAKAGHYTEAIVAFKKSNALAPRASSSCLIGLAYTRRELWPQAEIMIDRCKRDANPADPPPEWLPALEKELAQRLATIGVAAVTISVIPASARVELSVSSFAPDELFGPRTIHLPPGSHVITARAPGFPAAHETIEIKDADPRTIVIDLREKPRPVVVPVQHSAVPLALLGAGGALVAAGVVYHATALRTAANGLADATDATPDDHLYTRWSHTYDVRREVVIGLYAAGAITAGIGLVLRLREKDRETLPQVSIVPTDGGGIVTVGW